MVRADDMTARILTRQESGQGFEQNKNMTKFELFVAKNMTARIMTSQESGQGFEQNIKREKFGKKMLFVNLY